MPHPCVNYESAFQIFAKNLAKSATALRKFGRQAMEAVYLSGKEVKVHVEHDYRTDMYLVFVFSREKYYRMDGKVCTTKVGSFLSKSERDKGIVQIWT